MNYIEEVYNNINLKEDKNILSTYLQYIYIYQKLSNKNLSALLNLPIPIIVAIKKEFIKLKILIQKNGINLTEKGIEFVEKILGLKDIDKDLIIKINDGNYVFSELFSEEISELNELFLKRPPSDLSIDQTECTPETSLKRAVLAMKYNSVLGKNILCIGDDDLVSVSLALLLKKIYGENINSNTKITVVDVDDRLLHILEELNKKYKGIEFEFIKHDLINPLPNNLTNYFDTVFTDPPYTLNGLKLFLYRGKSALKNEATGKLFLSFGEKDDEFKFSAQGVFQSLDFIIENIYCDFNKYNGASVIGNRSDMIILTSLRDKLNQKFYEKIYTGTVVTKIKEYKCKTCKTVFQLGEGKKYKFIEDLKKDKCPNCGNDIFQLLKVKKIN